MTPSSAKQKGRVLQQWVVKQILDIFPLSPKDVRSTSMGAGGGDVVLSEKAFNLLPYEIECKNQEAVNVWAAYEQASKHGDGQPLVIIKRNRTKPLALVDAQHFLTLVRLAREAKE